MTVSTQVWRTRTLLRAKSRFTDDIDYRVLQVFLLRIRHLFDQTVDGFMSSQATTPADANSMTSSVRGFVSLAIFIHLCFVFLAITSNVEPSLLQQRLLLVARPYAQLLNIDLSFTPYHLTHATIDDVDHRIEVLPAGKMSTDEDNWVSMPDVGWRGTERYARYQRLASMMAYFSAEEDTAALLAESICKNFLEQSSITPQRIRCRKHLLQNRSSINGLAADRDPFAQQYFRDVYTANVLVGADGQINVVPTGSAQEMAQPDTNRK